MAAKKPAVTGPTERPDARPPHPNPIRRFREELRLTRQQFVRLIHTSTDNLRMWEGSGRTKATRPKGEAAIAIVELAQRNFYPLTIQDIYHYTEQQAVIKKKIKKKTKRKAN